MNVLRPAGLAVWFALSAVPVWAADPAPLRPAITKEPAYQSEKPRYCLLAFGPAQEVRTWLVVDGEAVYLDHNGNGDLTDKGERFAPWGSEQPSVPITAAGKATDYEVTFVQLLMAGDRKVVQVGASTKGKFRQYGDALLTERPQDAAVLHFDGPLTMFLQRKLLLRGERPLELHAGVATVSPAGDAGVFVEYDPAIPEGLAPEAEIEFPGKGGQAKPIVVKLRLKERC